MVECAACAAAGRVTDACPVCRGNGAHTAPDPREEAPAAVIACAEVLRARAAIEKYGVEGWLRMEDAQRCGPHPLLADAISVIDAELARLAHEESVEAARKARALKAAGR